MSKTITISMSDAEYEALQAASAQIHQSPEELAAATIAEHVLGATPASLSRPITSNTDPIVEVMRARGHLASPEDPRSYPGVQSIPPRGSAERDRFEEELAEDLGVAFEQSGLSILDLVERR